MAHDVQERFRDLNLASADEQPADTSYPQPQDNSDGYFGKDGYQPEHRHGIKVEDRDGSQVGDRDGSQDEHRDGSQDEHRDRYLDGHPERHEDGQHESRDWEKAEEGVCSSQESTQEPNNYQAKRPSQISDVVWEDTPTPPIDMPNVVRDGAPDGEFHERTGSPQDTHSLEYHMRHRRPSVSFNPRVKLEGGEKKILGESLPKLSIQTRIRGRSLLEDIAKQKRSVRAKSETNREDYDPETGERYYDAYGRQRDGRYTANEPRWPLLQSTVDGLAAAERQSMEIQQPASLTSMDTASQHDEACTPSSARMENLPSPLSNSSRADWFAPTSHASPRRLSSRSRSYALHRTSSLRRISRRSTSNSISPASAFLSKYLPSSPPASPDAEGQEVGDYVLGREIGFGGFSIIREAETISDGQRIRHAVKIVRRHVTGKEEAENDALQAEWEHEIELWRCLSHKHVLPLYAVYVTSFATFAFTQLNTGGTLFDAVRANRSGLKPNLVRRYSHQLAAALRYLHEDMCIVHRDVKLENCLLDMTGPDAHAAGGKLLLCDFGLADYCTSENQSKPSTHGPIGQNLSSQNPIGHSDTSTSLAGSLPYAAPELLDVKLGSSIELLSPSIDMWAFGAVCFALAMGRLPFMHEFEPRVRVMILAGEWDRGGLERKESACNWNNLSGDFESVAERSGVANGPEDNIPTGVLSDAAIDPKFKPDGYDSGDQGGSCDGVGTGPRESPENSNHSHPNLIEGGFREDAAKSDLTSLSIDKTPSKYGLQTPPSSEKGKEVDWEQEDPRSVVLPAPTEGSQNVLNLESETTPEATLNLVSEPAQVSQLSLALSPAPSPNLAPQPPAVLRQGIRSDSSMRLAPETNGSSTELPKPETHLDSPLHPTARPTSALTAQIQSQAHQQTQQPQEPQTGEISDKQVSQEHGPSSRLLQGDLNEEAHTFGSAGHARPQDLRDIHVPNGAPPVNFLAGISELVAGCLDMAPNARWNVRMCLTARWLDAEGGLGDEVTGWRR